jgi:hypothetical protein
MEGRDSSGIKYYSLAKINESNVKLFKLHNFFSDEVSVVYFVYAYLVHGLKT